MKHLKILTLIIIIITMTNYSAKAQIEVNKEYTSESGLKYVFTKKVNGLKVEIGDKVSVHYTGRLTNDTIFDSSFKRGKPFEFTLGQGQVIKGWDEGIALMNVGDKATFTIPPDLGYGESNMGAIPANSTLIFNVVLMGVTPAIKPFNVEGKDTITTASGLQYIIVENGTGTQAKPDMSATVHYAGYFRNGKKFDASYDRDEPIKITLGKRMVIPGWEEGLLLLKVGDKARFIIPYNLAYGEVGREPIIPPKTDLIFDVELIDLKEIEKPKEFDVLGKDTIAIESGLKYIKTITTDGKQAKAGNTVKVHYTGYLLDGTIFDSSVQRGTPFEFPLGQGRVIKGWDEGIALLKVGEKARLIIPYELAYGEQEVGPIPAKSTLIFDVELIEVK
ncbi:MAG: FKBP-type peptidyl-prolyl cis-trans isomerase [Saprospiraceae bacterium]|nr:FKBP-type peptidyl-prolyl cis-trans isomerase [Saprospiraceae bacterium]